MSYLSCSERLYSNFSRVPHPNLSYMFRVIEIKMEQTMHLQGKVALVTGTGSGIGRATVKTLARHGAKVAALNRTNDELQTLINEVNAERSDHTGEAIPLLADISKPEEMEKAVQEVIRQW